MSSNFLNITDLAIELPAGSDRKYAVREVNLKLAPKETLCVVGESGSGKSLTARAIMGLLPAPHVKVTDGSIHFNGDDLTKVSYEHLRQIRGSEIQN